MSQSCICPSEEGASCSAQNVSSRRATCPTNGRVGRRISLVTVQAQWAGSLAELRSAEYHFCSADDCPTVYYSADGAQVLGEAEVREPVYQKQRQADTALVCYCFRHTVGSIRREIAQTGTTTVLEAIEAGIQAGKCACEIRNPQGTCCLGNVRALVWALQRQSGPHALD